jgi:hydrophobic/amphiphilic exporter-1 (mainly G- bacteria), HAE1 family
MRSLINTLGRITGKFSLSGLTRLALFNRWLTLVLAVALVGISVWATLRMKQEMIPNIETGMTTVVTVYPLHSSEDVIANVTAPMEDAIGDLGAKRVSSSSMEGMSVILAEFEYGANMKEVNSDILDKLSGLGLPEDMPRKITDPSTGIERDNPLIFPLDISVMPVVAYSLGADIDPNELYSIVATQVAPELETIKGVLEESGVSIDGYREDAIITPIASQMNANGVSMAQLVGTLKNRSEYGSLDDIRNMPLSASGTVGQVANVGFGPASGSAITRTNGQPCVILYVTKSSDGNTVEVARAVNDRMAQIEEQLPNVTFVKIFDQSDYIRQSVGELTQDALIGGILAVIVIFIFLLSVRGSMVIALSIPFSIFVGFLIMSAVGVTINILTMGAMTIAVGRIVDDSIVMLEVVYRRLRQGQPIKQAAIEGSREVAMPIASATIATVAIFIPLAFVGGMVGEMFMPFAETITFALLGSLLVSLTVVPALCGMLVPKDIKPETENAWYQHIYMPALKWSLAHRVLTVVIALALFAASLALLPVIGTSFMPAMGDKEVMIEVEMPLGSDIRTTDAKAAKVESLLESLRSDSGSGIDIYYTTVGTSGSFGGAMSALMGGGGSNTATIEVLLKDDASMNKVAKDLEASVEKEELESEGCRINITPMASGLGAMDPGQFKVFLVGDNYTAVEQAAQELTVTLAEDVDGLTNVETDTSRTINRANFIPNEDKIVSFYMNQGLSPLEYYDDLEKEVGLLKMGTTLTDNTTSQNTIYVDGRGIYVNPILATATPGSLGGILLTGGTSTATTLSSVADDVGFEPSQLNIHSIDGKRSATVSATVTKKDVGAVNTEAQKKADAVAEQYGVGTRIGGVSEYMNETFTKMAIAMLIAIIISFAIVVVSFRSFLNALVIMVSLPLATIGAFLGLLITRNTMGASGMMGMLMLVGIVLTNAIVLLALVDQLRKQGVNTHDALIQAGRTRIRPILMTAITTMVGLLPLALGYGQGILLASELAIVVLGGLISSTILTLIVVPVLYSLTDPIRRRAKVNAAFSETTAGKPPAE